MPPFTIPLVPILIATPPIIVPALLMPPLTLAEVMNIPVESL